MREIERIIVHHTAGTHGTAASIRHHHVERRGWIDIGYHYLILNGRVGPELYVPEMNGACESGRPLGEVGAHDQGQNVGSIGIALVARDVPTWPQMVGLHKLVQGLRASFGALAVEGHCEHEPPSGATACPGSRLAPRLVWLRGWLAAPAPDPRSEELLHVLAPR